MTNLQNVFFGAALAFLATLIIFLLPIDEIIKFYILMGLVLVCLALYDKGRLFKRGDNYIPPIPKEEEITHLRWVYDRLKHVHNENDNYDYMLRLKQIIDDYGKREESI